MDPAPPASGSRASTAALIVLIAGVFGGAFFLWLKGCAGGGLPVMYGVPEFALTESRGQPFGLRDLRGHVWAVDFVFTNCPSICPTLASRMYELQEQLPDDFLLVSITVDPERDTPEVMREKAEKYWKSKPGRWFWLTGEKRLIYDLMQNGFKVGQPGPAGGSDIPHTPYILLVDASGRVRGVYDAANDAEAWARLRRDAGRLQTFRNLPALNAGLNGLCAVLLATGFLLIRARRVTAHKLCMLSACVVSAVFLASYLTYHHVHGATPFPGQGWIRPVYFAILISHTVLAALIVPMVAVTLVNALRARFESHRAIARWTLPVWLYVSVTGVVVYALLYVVRPGS